MTTIITTPIYIISPTPIVVYPIACTSSGVRHEVTDEYPYADNYEARDDVTMTYTVEVEMVGPEADRKAIYNAYAVFECEVSDATKVYLM